MITLTDSAVMAIKDMMKEHGEENAYLRFGVTGGGCSGLSYSIHFSNEKETGENEYQINGLSVLLKEKDIPIIKNTVIDYKQNLLGGGFTIENPNAILTCGCGTSFRTKENEGKKEEC